MKKMFLSTLVVFGFMNFGIGQSIASVERISVKAYDTDGKVEQFQLRGADALSFDVPTYIKENDHLERLTINGSLKNELTTTIINFDSNSQDIFEGDAICKDVQSKLTPFLGVWGTTTRKDHKGVDVRKVIPTTGAAAAGIMKGESITEFDGVIISNFPELKTAVLSSEIGDRVELTIQKDAEEYTKSAVVGSRGLTTVTYKYCKEEQVESLASNDVSIEEVSLNSYPNPTTALSHINFKSGSDADVIFNVMDINGNLIHKEIFTNFDGNLKLDYNLNSASDGTYIISIQQGEEVYTRKVQLIK